ncbi:hypothetical protein Z517_11969 [Fonsecaea pedrosoi CBS 271.37]|uniref:aldehyde dehydrogenase (NAD(+)) n=1 Tax=Fonsecaea pedrosoi CBS 271.37 TaxID=1442368 RepID=A0A0D2DC55_9EURO|nr:uncharacterized protein Z517_11969 [Fonsecaea pedrosoi CBS 271.37]KIW75196.1 hypothetical protein Z517_11969 [Fonsecaea pedrosoi CBS 271.37]
MAPLEFSIDRLPTDLFIDNEFVTARSGKTLSVFNPKDGSLVSDKVSVAGPEDVDMAVQAAERALPAWKRLKAVQRRDLMLKLADLIEENIEILGELTRITLGAPFETWGKHEILIAVETFRYYAGWVDKLAGETYPQEDGFLKIVRNEPLGVVAGIVPWNGPIGSIGMKAAPALAVGNCFILKPSEKTPLGSLAIGALIQQAGFPPGVFQILSGDGSTGALLASHMRVRKVSFTGSVSTGKKIQELAAKSNLKRVTLELGGKSPVVIFNDCDVKNALEWAVRSITANTGQVCFAGSRVYVQEGLYDSFLKQYKEAIEARAKVMGDPDDPKTELGPLIDEAQFQRVSGFIERGQKDQGQILTGGKRIGDKGYFLEPTVFTNVKSDAEIYREEIFGPVAVINSFKTEEEIIELSNDTEFGLMAGVFTQDINKALRVASEFDAGTVGINCVSLFAMTAPFGGSKQSGIGRELGLAGLRAFTEPKTILVNMNY